MIATSAKFKGHPCFKEHWSGLDGLRPVTLVIGKNNTGKSHLLQFIKELCNNTLGKIPWDLRVVSPLNEEGLSKVFQRNCVTSGLGGADDWFYHGVHFNGKTAIWTRESGRPDSIDFLEGTFYRDGVSMQTSDARLLTLRRAMPESRHILHGKIFKHLLADRDIQPEPESNKLTLESNGRGATNIIRRYIHSSESRFNRDLVQVEMLDALNHIFASDGNFKEITVKHHDGSDPEKPNNIWEIYLEQEHKGLVSLSSSGSGLRTIFLVLLHLLVIPAIEGKHLRQYVFAFEELENNLHPSLLRNLLEYIKSKCADNPIASVDTTPHLFLTTHSNVALDYFAGSDISQIIYISHDGKSASAQTIDHSQKLLDVLWDLGSRPSDLLQANGIIWVEGPSDRIYINKWIELFGEGKFKEGRHYQCAFYGGGLLARLQATSVEEADDNLVNLLKINPNALVVSDSDRKAKGTPLKKRVRRIRDEFARLDKERSCHWILEAREIENYLTGELIGSAAGVTSGGLPDPGQYESVFRKDGEESYMETHLKRKTIDKVDLAVLATGQMSADMMRGRFDLDSKMKRILSIIAVWNQ